MTQKTLRMYDITTDEWRPATQKDIDDLLAVQLAYGRLRGEIKKRLADVHEELLSRIAINEEEHADG